MPKKYEEFSEKVRSAFHDLANKDAEYNDACMLFGAAETNTTLRRRTVRKSIDTEWIEKIEAALPALDVVVRTPFISIQEEEEVVAVELTRRISEKSIKHLAQHTNLIREIKDDEITPSHILNVYREESYLTYENKFINTLLVRLSAFIDKRYRALQGGSGIEQDYLFDYGTEFEHFAEGDDRRNSARIGLHIELTSPIDNPPTELDGDINAKYSEALDRIGPFRVLRNSLIILKPKAIR